MGDLPGGMFFRQCPMPYTRWSPNFTPLKTPQFEIDTHLYSSDFYRLARTRLQPSGLLAQWWPLPTQNDEDSRSLVRSFLDAFPYASLWTTEFHEMLLVGSAEPIELDMSRIAACFDQPKVAAALREVGIASPAALLATWVTDRAEL